MSVSLSNAAVDLWVYPHKIIKSGKGGGGGGGVRRGGKGRRRGGCCYGGNGIARERHERKFKQCYRRPIMSIHIKL